MSHPATLTATLLAQVVDDEIRATGLSEREVERRTGISRDTLKRRIAAGSLDSAQLIRAADLLGIKLSTLIARAEKRAA